MWGSAAGIFAGAFDLAWYPDAQIRTPKGVYDVPFSWKNTVTKVMRPMAWCAASGAAYSLGACLSEQMRGGQKDPLNAANGGALAGLVMGSMSRRFDVMTATAIGLWALMGVADGFRFGEAFVLDPDHFNHRNFGMRAKQHTESEELDHLKKLYPKYKDY